MPSTEYWDQSWQGSEPTAKSWFQQRPEPSLELVISYTSAGGSVIDVGGGASALVDHLLTSEFGELTVVDISDLGMAEARRRLGSRSGEVEWVVADVTTLDLGRQFDTWHDRAALHFLIEDGDRAAYADAVRRHVRPGGHVILATFAPDGPQMCSGLPVRRQSVDDLSDLMGPEFDLLEDRRVEHTTPQGAVQPFTYTTLARRGED